LRHCDPDRLLQSKLEISLRGNDNLLALRYPGYHGTAAGSHAGSYCGALSAPCDSSDGRANGGADSNISSRFSSLRFSLALDYIALDNVAGLANSDPIQFKLKLALSTEFAGRTYEGQCESCICPFRYDDLILYRDIGVDRRTEGLADLIRF
jgi:hypothetical protein